MNPQPNMLYIHALIKMTRGKKIISCFSSSCEWKKEESNLAFTCFEANILEKLRVPSLFDKWNIKELLNTRKKANRHCAQIDVCIY